MIGRLDDALKMLAGQPRRRPGFSYQRPDTELSEQQRAKSASLMRVNHCGEVCAQALYHGQALTARDEKNPSPLAPRCRRGSPTPWLVSEPTG